MLAPTPNTSLKRSQLWNNVTIAFFAAGGVVGSVGAVLIVLGVDVLVNPMLALAAGALHALAVVLVLTLTVDLWTLARTTKWTELTVIELIGVGLLAIAAAVGCVVVDRVVRNSSFPAHYVAVYVLVCVGMSLVAAGATIHVLRPGTTSAQLPIVRALVAMLGLVLASAGVGGYAAGSAWHRNTDVTSGPDLGALPAIAGIHGTYVALGDSYSAGEGLRPFDQWTALDCHRSSQAYPRLLRFVAPVPVLFAACSGAVSHDVLHDVVRADGTLVRAAQVPTGIHPEVGLVTLSVGGNDVVFSKAVVHCFLHTDCLRSWFRAPAEDPNRGLLFPPSQPFGSWADEALEMTRAKMAVLYPELRERFPEARIVVVGYPYLFPDRTAPLFDLSDCQSVLRRFSNGERRAVRALQDELNTALYREALAAGIEFVSPASGWDGHEPCGEHAQYTNSIKPFVQFETARNIVDGGTFHPNAAGQRELARTVTCYLLAAPATPGSEPAASPPGSLQRPLGC